MNHTVVITIKDTSEDQVDISIKIDPPIGVTATPALALAATLVEAMNEWGSTVKGASKT